MHNKWRHRHRGRHRCRFWQFAHCNQRKRLILWFRHIQRRLNHFPPLLQRVTFAPGDPLTQGPGNLPNPKKSLRRLMTPELGCDRPLSDDLYRLTSESYQRHQQKTKLFQLNFFELCFSTRRECQACQCWIVEGLRGTISGETSYG